jgi:hypothetical protein
LFILYLYYKKLPIISAEEPMWEDIRSLFIGYSVDSMEEILIALYYGFEKQKPLILGNQPSS